MKIVDERVVEQPLTFGEAKPGLVYSIPGYVGYWLICKAGGVPTGKAALLDDGTLLKFEAGTRVTLVTATVTITDG